MIIMFDIFKLNQANYAFRMIHKYFNKDKNNILYYFYRILLMFTEWRHEIFSQENAQQHTTAIQIKQGDNPNVLLDKITKKKKLQEIWLAKIKNPELNKLPE